MAPGGVEPPPADSKSAALSTELRGLARAVCPRRATPLARLRARRGRERRRRARPSRRTPCRRGASARSAPPRPRERGRYGRSEIIATYALQTRMIRAASGDLLAGETVGIAAAVPVLVARADDARRRCASAGDARRIRSPTIVCWRTNAHSRSSSGPGLWRISSGTASLPRSWSWAARSSSSSSSRRSPSILPTSVRERRRRRLAAPRAPARGSRAPRGAPPSSARSLRGASTSARRGARPPSAARWLASVASSGRRTAPNELPISKPSPFSESASHARSISGSASPSPTVAMRQNSSPPSRYTEPASPGTVASFAPSRTSSASPAGWPKLSL